MKAKINGINQRYEILGQTGYPIVLIHGYGLDHSIWMALASKYLRNYRVIMPDLRGHGESDATMEVYKMSILAEDIARLLDFLGINKATICGHSLGGYVSLAFAEYFPEKLAGLGLITTRAKADSEEKRARRYELAEEVQERGAVALADTLAMKLSLDEEIIKKVYNLIIKTPINGIIGASKGMAERPDQTSLLQDINVPALVVAGDKDQIIRVDEARNIADNLPQAKFLVIPGAGHMSMMEAQEALAEGLIELIQRVEAL